MSLMQNEFAGKSEIIFICYDDVIKSPYPYILNKINEKYHPFYKDFLELDIIKDMDIADLEMFCNTRENKNVFYDLAKIEFDADGSLADLAKNFEDMYFELPLLEMGTSLDTIKSQKFTEKIYVYTKEYDLRIHLDIQKTFRDMKMVNYVSGDFDDVIASLEGVTSYILDDISYVPSIFFHGKGDFVNIMVANYGYNYYVDDEDEVVKLKIDVDQYATDNTFKFATFSPMEMVEDHFKSVAVLDEDEDFTVDPDPEE